MSCHVVIRNFACFHVHNIITNAKFLIYVYIYIAYLVEIGDVVERCCRGEGGGGGGAVMRTLVCYLPRIEMTVESRACG